MSKLVEFALLTFAFGITVVAYFAVIYIPIATIQGLAHLTLAIFK